MRPCNTRGMNECSIVHCGSWRVDKVQGELFGPEREIDAGRSVEMRHKVCVRYVCKMRRTKGRKKASQKVGVLLVALDINLGEIFENKFVGVSSAFTAWNTLILLIVTGLSG